MMKKFPGGDENALSPVLACPHFSLKKTCQNAQIRSNGNFSLGWLQQNIKYKKVPPHSSFRIRASLRTQVGPAESSKTWAG